jgi:hypothetical protein
MKQLNILLIPLLFIFSCTEKDNSNTIKDETMKLHDEVMANHSKIIANQMKIDTLLWDLKKVKARIPMLDTLTEKTELSKLKAELMLAEESMNDWMHNFNPDFTNTSEWEVIHYYKKERDKIAKVDELYKREIKRSDNYLNKFK